MKFDVNDFFSDFGPTIDQSINIIKVIGVGDGGCNAVNNMYKEGIKNVTFAVCNTDSLSLERSPVPVKIQLGKGPDIGTDLKQGKDLTEKSIDSIKKLLENGTKIVFVTAGMGGSTGTDAAPIIAGIAKGMGVLTVGIVTMPFSSEKKKEMTKALKGMEEMSKNVDSLLVINNEQLCHVNSDSEMSVKDSFKQADEIISNTTRGISELIMMKGNLNFEFCSWDVKETLKNGGRTIMVMGKGNGERRIEMAIIEALDSHLLYNNDINMAKKILIHIYTSKKVPLFVKELEIMNAFIEELNPNIYVMWGVSDDNSLEEDAKVAILATGFDDDPVRKPMDKTMKENAKQQLVTQPERPMISFVDRVKEKMHSIALEMTSNGNL
jgi:cell division protein FtsZ